MKRLRAVLGGVLMFGLLAMAPMGCSDSDSSTNAVSEIQGKYFLIESGTGLLVAPGQALPSSMASDEAETYTLILDNVADQVSWYADRPSRTTGEVTIEEFAWAQWPALFSEIPPNAVLDCYVSDQAVNDGMFLTVKGASYDAVSKRLVFSSVELHNWTLDEKPTTSLSLKDLKLTVLPNCTDSGKNCWSFAQVSPMANFIPSDEEGVYELQLIDVYPEMYHFTHAPGFASEILSSGQMPYYWQEYFSDSPPNASLTGYTGDNALSLVLLELNNPSFDASSNTFTYKATVLRGTVNADSLLYGTTLLIDSQGGGGSGYPGCPDWAHQIKFVNKCSKAVSIPITNGCYGPDGTKIDHPPFNGGRCWPSPKIDGKAVETIELGASGSTDPNTPDTKTLRVLSCWSGNIGSECQTCTTKIQTRVEFTFDGGIEGVDPYKKIDNTIDNYDLSFVDGFYQILKIAPDTSIPKDPSQSCDILGCDKAPVCTTKLTDGDACLSPCKYVTGPGSGDFTDEEKRKYCASCDLESPCTCNDDNVAAGGCCAGPSYGCSPFSPPGSDHLDTTACPWYKPELQPPYTKPNCSSTTADRAWDAWAQEYIALIHEGCPGQYAWQYDDGGTRTCEGNNVAMNYTVTILCSE